MSSNLKYSKTHEWVDFIAPNRVRIGLSDYAQESMGDLVFVTLPEVGQEVSGGDVIGDVESVKAVSDLYSPVSGVVVAVNEDLEDQPELINEEPYSAWLFEIDQVTDQVELLDQAAYEAFCEEEG